MRRDLAIAGELRKLHPDLQVDWLAQHPVTELLARRGERIHPASAFLASESRHIEGESAEHDLHAFQAIRRMDEVLVSNFMVFAEAAAGEPYDLWVGVRHRLARYRAGRCLDYEETGPDSLAQAIAEEARRQVSYRPVETNGAARAAAHIAELI